MSGHDVKVPKVRIKLPKGVKELADRVASLVDVAGQAVASGSHTVRQAKKTARKATRAAAGLGGIARAGRDAASDLRTAFGQGPDIREEAGTVVVDLSGIPSGDQGEDDQ